MTVAEPVVDVRIAAWLLKPDAMEVTDSLQARPHGKELPYTLEGLLTRQTSKEHVNDAVTALQKVSGVDATTFFWAKHLHVCPAM